MQASAILTRILVVDSLGHHGSVVARLAAPFLRCSALLSSCIFAVEDDGESEHRQAGDEDTEGEADY